MASLMRPALLRQACQASRQATPLSQALRPAFSAPSAIQQQRIAAFHATQRQQILPPLPQKIQGTLNDPVKVPTPEYAHGSYHWTFERMVAAGLIPLTVAPFVSGSLNPVMDATLCALLIIHSHTGFESCIIDYFPKDRVPKSRAAAMWALRIATVTMGVALYSFETNDVGITEAAKKLWHA